MTDRFLIIGGGIRLQKACDAFIREGYKAEIYKGGKPLKVAVGNADVILLGLPASPDGENTELENGEKIPLRDIAALCGGRKKGAGRKVFRKSESHF